MSGAPTYSNDNQVLEDLVSNSTSYEGTENCLTDTWILPTSISTFSSLEMSETAIEKDPAIEPQPYDYATTQKMLLNPRIASESLEHTLSTSTTRTETLDAGAAVDDWLSLKSAVDTHGELLQGHTLSRSIQLSGIS
jgi:hypothetical protein